MHVRCAHRQTLREISARIVCRCTQSKLRASATSSYNTRRDTQVLGWGVALLDSMMLTRSRTCVTQALRASSV
jgi:hypothetical protein